MTSLVSECLSRAVLFEQHENNKAVNKTTLPPLTVMRDVANCCDYPSFHFTCLVIVSWPFRPTSQWEILMFVEVEEILFMVGRLATGDSAQQPQYNLTF